MAEARPSRMTRAEFVETFGHVFEHSAWVAERTWEMGVDELWDTADGLHQAMSQAVDSASEDEKLELLSAHPDLAGRLALAGELTRESTREQSAAGLDRCSPEELERFQRLNAKYTERFGIPFIMAVRGSTRADILAAFERRLSNDRSQETDTALAEVKKIALFRLRDLLS